MTSLRNERLQCRCCNKTFSNNELILIVNKRLFGIEEKVCPSCKSNTYGLIDYPVDEELLIYKSNNFYKKDKTNRHNIKQYDIYDFISE